MRQKYEMSVDGLAKILKACEALPYILGSGGVEPPDPMIRINRVWEELGEEMGFQHMTVKPVSGKGQRHFTAEPVE